MNLQAIVRTYVTKIRPSSQAELKWFEQLTLREAIQTAALATNSRGKRYSHQRRIIKVALEEAKHILLSNEGFLSNCITFDELFLAIDTLLRPVYGLGELYIYDTTLRIGANLGLLPAKVYLHAGTRVGAEAIGFTSDLATIEISNLPKEFQQLEAYEIEDVLCIYKKQLTASETEDLEFDSSWCE
jgi:hypothetical protein